MTSLLSPIDAVSTQDQINSGLAEAAGLMPFASELVRLADAQQITPVLVTPSYLRLQPPFFVALAESIWRTSMRPAQIDWAVQGDSLLAGWSQWNTQRLVDRVNRLLSQIDRGQISLTETIGRPQNESTSLVVGLADPGIELPTWATAIPFGLSR
ncbi:MAG: hypothetical protein AAGA03_09105 [Planctomycetota bacterium]